MANNEPENVTQQVEEMRELAAKMESMKDDILKNAPVQSVPEETPELPKGTRVFVSPAHKNCRFLAKAGTVVKQPSPQGPWDHSRDGDVWVQFSNGYVVVTGDKHVIAWCEAHTDVCRDAFAPETEAWAALTEATLETSTESAKLPKNTDIEKLLSGEAQGLADSDSLVSQARRAAVRS